MRKPGEKGAPTPAQMPKQKQQAKNLNLKKLTPS